MKQEFGRKRRWLRRGIIEDLPPQYGALPDYGYPSDKIHASEYELMAGTVGPQEVELGPYEVADPPVELGFSTAAELELELELEASK